MDTLLEDVYKKHHGDRRREGFAILEEERGALFKKLMEDRTNGVISIQILVDGKPVSIEAVA